jgi:uncharacterized protein (TIGR00255 family)
MTGYGRAEAACGDKKIAVELRSVNGKQLDLNIKIPSQYRELEPEIRRALSVLQRGKVDVFIFTENQSAATVSSINEEMFKAYYAQLKKLSAELNEAFSIGEILRLPEVVGTGKNEVSEEEKSCVLSCVEKSVQAFTEFRKREGATIMADILHRVELILQLLAQVEPFEKKRIETTKERLQNALNEVAATSNIDKNRFEQELIYYLEKLDVTEEKTRLRSHCALFSQTANGEENAGRKLGFIAQEMGREINTLGSKANDSNMQRIVVNMKDELEKIKEQLLNVL